MKKSYIITAAIVGLGLASAGTVMAAGPLNGFGRQTMLDAKAKVMNMTATQLETELQAGKTIAAVAASKNVTLDQLKAATLNAQKSRLDALVKSGNITQSQADSRIAQIKDRQADCDGTGTNRQNKKLGAGRGMGLRLHTQ
jgi:multidrug resistance efflux pump